MPASREMYLCLFTHPYRGTEGSNAPATEPPGYRYSGSFPPYKGCTVVYCYSKLPPGVTVTVNQPCHPGQGLPQLSLNDCCDCLQGPCEKKLFG